MSIILEILTLFGGISVFIYGLDKISKSAESIAVGKMEKVIKGALKNPFSGLITGGICAGVCQSSVAVNMITVGFVEAGVVDFYSSCAVIMGANVGTTATAQIISIIGVGGAEVGIFSAFIGLLLTAFSNGTLKNIGSALIGLGLMFSGLTIMGERTDGFIKYEWFNKIFLTESPLLLFFNGMLLTGITQSSSAITSIMIILASREVMPFGNATFMILGCNIGSCFAVIFASLNKGLSARRSAWFNLFFNVFGSVLFFPLLLIAYGSFPEYFVGGNFDVGRSIANFHTVFNLVSALIMLPLLKPMTKFIEKIVKDDTKIATYKKSKRKVLVKSRI